MASTSVNEFVISLLTWAHSEPPSLVLKTPAPSVAA